MLDKREWALLRRLTRWLDQFRECFGHQAQRVSLREYLHGLLSDSPRKSMQAMLARVTEPRSYQAFQHFITDAPWDAACLWRRVLALLPERRGVLILDDTAFLKRGTESVGVATQYASRRHHITTCQVAVTAALWTGLRSWFVGAELYLPRAWLTPERRAQARIPATRRFEEKWRLALHLVRRVRAAGMALDAVVADAGYGDNAALRMALARMGLADVLGIASDTTVQTPLSRIARLAHCRWAVEQQYRELKTNLGIDHFEGRTSPGWHHHIVLTAVAHAFLQQERLRAGTDSGLTLPQVRAIAQEIFTALILITRPRYYASLERARLQYMELRI